MYLVNVWVWICKLVYIYMCVCCVNVFDGARYLGRSIRAFTHIYIGVMTAEAILEMWIYDISCECVDVDMQMSVYIFILASEP